MRSIIVSFLILSTLTINPLLWCQAQEEPETQAAEPQDAMAPGEPVVDESALSLTPVEPIASEEQVPVPPPKPVGVLTFEDVPNDDGSSLILRWTPDSGYPQTEMWVARLTQPQQDDRDQETQFEQEFILAASQDGIYQATVRGVQHKRIASVQVHAVAQGVRSEPSETFTGKSYGNLFNTRRVNVLIALSVFVALVIYFVNRAKSGASLFIRRIAGLDAVEEAVGRATEMGRPILFVPGLSSMTDVATIAALNILGPIAEKVASYETKIIVPNRDPIVYTVAHEVVKASFSKAGRPDLFTDDLVFFITESQFGYAAAVDGIMVRERPATNFFLGMFWAESLVMAETGAATGAIQIAGTDSVTQLPFFIVSCDYTLIGEELYAASAYLGGEPVLKGTLKAQDYMKIVLLVMTCLGVVLAAFEKYWFYTVLGLQ